MNRKTHKRFLFALKENEKEGANLLTVGVEKRGFCAACYLNVFSVLSRRSPAPGVLGGGFGDGDPRGEHPLIQLFGAVLWDATGDCSDGLLLQLLKARSTEASARLLRECGSTCQVLRRAYAGHCDCLGAGYRAFGVRSGLVLVL